ncbi:hypothetical protein SEA_SHEDLOCKHOLMES_90 [Mycobacterium phage ShedlockHolmes]|uniref:Uncharacterized protein n=3 Tax=Keshuvirus TaxID=2948781 RepID=G1D4Z6_9CAUD|nr:hypothetical protein SEA_SHEDLOCKHOLMES_90 [Mycobacterium phage ShedlockHolmes]YP_009637425.1 hypothetical protein FGG30_gp087 [Mycobacterium phage Pixie]AEK09897.1 hypothetical protein PBI_PIXIE_87 [Mycobacterium phage Pixie]AKF15267.1 hypothetical protein SEA_SHEDLOCKHOLMES_90 [Mycobacterium phage ShedlockHolmes]AOT23823.1 hypothetical protein SEA_TBOND007_84 [Mycobacterium phage TBond007]
MSASKVKPGDECLTIFPVTREYLCRQPSAVEVLTADAARVLARMCDSEGYAAAEVTLAWRGSLKAARRGGPNVHKGAVDAAAQLGGEDDGVILFVFTAKAAKR